MRIGFGSPLFIQDQLRLTTQAISRSLARLSSGQRVNSPQDDMAAFSEGVTLDSQIRGFTQAIRNVNDATGLLQTATSAISTQIEIVQQMRELAVQAANGTISSTDRAGINTQLQSLLSEFSRITSSTQFNNIHLLDGSFGTQTIQIGSKAGDTASIQIPSLQGSTVFQKLVGTGNFSSSQVQLASITNGVTAGDFNGDGNQDVVVEPWGSNYVEVHLGNGTGTLSAGRTYATGGYVGVPALGPTVASLRNNGIQDIITSDFADNTVSILLGNGDGTFAPRTTLSATHALKAVAGDFNHDGKIDLAVATDSGVNLFLGNGNGTFASSTTIYTAGASPSDMVAGDLNNDGSVDLVVATNAGNAIVLFGNGNGTFQSPITNAIGGGLSAIKLADLNGDGKLDVITTDNGPGKLEVAMGNGNGTFKATQAILTGSIPLNFAVTDFNGDGIQDIAVGDIGNGIVTILTGNGDGTFKTNRTFTTPQAGPEFVTSADLNNDGIPDLLIGDSGGSANLEVYLNGTQQVSAISNIAIQTQSDAQNLINILNNTLTALKSDQAGIGAVQDRLNETSAYNSLLVQNLTDAKSKALDTDIAAETADLVRNQILEQAQVSALTQANLQVQLVQSLLKPVS